MLCTRTASICLVATAVLWACRGTDSDAVADEMERDLSLPPAESVAVLSDEPAQDPSERSGGEEARPTLPPEQSREPQQPPVSAEVPDPEREPELVVPLSLPVGATLDLVAADTVSSRNDQLGDPITATTAAEVLDDDGRVVIPAGAIFTGTVAAIEPAGGPGGVGTMVLAFTQVHFDGNVYAVEARSDSLEFVMSGSGVTAGDAAKVGAGAVVGAIAGRILGKDTKGAVIGGVVGAAAGAGVAAATKDQDIVLPAGALVRIVLTAPLILEPEG